ncbi:hypothetical protein TSUD_138950 [Trifolium subterraneum]|uniref:TF-B3 domain-containing protein n=1 Tax=Trifolium subterraneum TaxID=3900 RepID=A0A2Z6PQ74_TRISU|nr:hypothetical protein TSUD_138950 [Trifolium subterraneum]
MSSRIIIATQFGLNEPTEVILEYLGSDNRFEIHDVNTGINEIPIENNSETDNATNFPANNTTPPVPFNPIMTASEINSFQRVDFNQDNVHTWIKKINITPGNGNNIQPLNIPRQFALQALGDATSIVLQSIHSNELIKCKIITAKRSETHVEKYLSSGWHKFVKDNNIKAGDKFIFKLPHHNATAIQAEIVRGNNSN